MVRQLKPWGHSKQKWTVNEISGPSGNARKADGWKKLKLLLWKNFLLQKRKPLQVVLEILLPLVFIAILAIIRIILPSTLMNEPTIFQPLEIDGVPSYIVRTKCNLIYYSPKNPVVDNLMEKVKTDYFDKVGLKYNFTGFETEEELVKAYDVAKSEEDYSTADVDTTSPVLAGIVFYNDFPNSSFPSDIKYKLRFPASQRSDFDAISEKFGLKAAWFTELIYPLFQLLGPRAPDRIGGGLPGYEDEGFLYLQYAIDRSLTRILLKDEKELEKYNQYDIKMQRFPYPPYIDDKYLFGLQAFLPLLLILTLIFPVLNITKCIVYEKEKRLKESMKMMGLSNWIHWTAWIIKSQAFLMVSSVIMAILLKAKYVESQALAVIPETDITLLIVLFFIYSFSAVCFCCLISSIFSRANTAALGAGAIWFFLYIPYAFIQPHYNTLSRNFKLAASLLTNNPMGFASQIICNFEGTGVGVQWWNIAEGSTPDDNFCMLDCMTLLIVNSIIFLLLAFYIEAVWPGEFGVPLPWNFIFKKWYWTGNFPHEPEYDLEVPEPTKRDSFFETDPNRKALIEIKNLTKRFGEKTAVNRMNLKMYESQVTALLGHNGAGKSTTMSMLTGLFPPTSGTANVNGYDICKEMMSVRHSLGICPQHDVLFDELTCEEHLKFFSALKGLDDSLVDAEVDRMLEALGLEKKRKAMAKTLSGGMKRKLSVGIAFCAGSKVVLLDEPTSGMDPGARRSTWDLIQSEKKGKCVLLSTHFMEEADLLGDRIAIMSQGEVRCCGSSLFLKKKYGGGYHLVIVKTPDCMVENITNVLKTAIPDVEIEQDIGAELSYTLPDSKSHLFPTLFSELESKRKDLGIASYGASITTMENVFMRVIREAEEETVLHAIDNPKFPKEDVKLQITGGHQQYMDRNSGLFLVFQQLWAMLLKKLIFLFRNRALAIASLVLPIFYIIITFCIMMAFPGFTNPDPLVLTLSSYETVGKTTTVVHCDPKEEPCRNYKEFVGQNYVIEEVRNGSNFIDHILEEASKELAAVNFQYIVGFEQRVSNKTNKTELIAFWNNQGFHASPLSFNILTNALLHGLNRTVEITNYPFPYSALDSLKEQGGIVTIGFQVGYNTALAMSFLAAYFIIFPIRERISGSKHLQYISGVKPFIYWVISFITDLLQFCVPCIGIICVLYLFEMEEFSTLIMQFYFLFLCVCYGLAVILLVYVFSFLFAIPTSGFAVLTVIFIFTGIAPMFAVSFLQNPEFQLDHIANEVNKYCLVFPNYALGMGIVQLSTNYLLGKSCSKHFNLEFLCSAFPESLCCKSLRENYLDWERSGIGRNLVYLLASAVVWAILLILIELKFFQGVRNCFRRTKHQDIDDDGDGEEDIEDSDVRAERERIQNGSLSTLNRTNNLIVRNLTKYYGDFLAVNNLNLGVQSGECFGLLGINGAGKTSTFKMLTGDYEPSSGDAYVGGYSIRRQLKKAHQRLGYCPQFDGLIGEMTGRETIRMFARLRGIREKDIGPLVDELADRLIFTPHIDKQVDNYSGGNKRKLSTAVALIGNPPIVFLDEPTTGMDPVARRHLWDAITMIRNQGTSIVLTSHSMEECEALCTRLVIMVNGSFRCLGSTQHLKNKFGKGYTIIAQTAPKEFDPNQPFTRSHNEQGRRRSSRSLKRTKSTDSSAQQQRNLHHWEVELQDLRAFIEERFPACTLKDIHPSFVHYHILPDENVSWGELFSAMEVAKVRFNLQAYSIGQTSLEQVFLNFTKAQINNT